MFPAFENVDDAALIRLISMHPLAWVISGKGTYPSATPLPLLAELDAEGRLLSFLGHFARSNPQVLELADNPQTTILFSGPDGYVSPKMVDEPGWAPTWNYAVARFRCEVTFVPEENDTALRSVTARMEQAHGGDWSVERMGRRYAVMKDRIIAFRARIVDHHATFKLGQDERRHNFDTITARLPDRQLADWMIAFRGVDQ